MRKCLEIGMVTAQEANIIKDFFKFNFRLYFFNSLVHFSFVFVHDKPVWTILLLPVLSCKCPVPFVVLPDDPLLVRGMSTAEIREPIY